MPATEAADDDDALTTAVRHLPVEIRRHLRAFLAAPYLGHAEMTRMAHRRRLGNVNLWCAHCGETGFGGRHMMLLCWSCNRTVCHGCWQGNHCCNCATMADRVL